MICIPDDKIELVQQFVDAFHSTQGSLNDGDREAAATGYKDMLGVYNQIASSSLDPLHKELAYDQLVKVYKGLQSPPSSIHTSTHIIAAAVLLMLFSFLVFFRPAVFGMVTAETQIAQDVNVAFVESGTHALHLDAAPRGLRVTGKVDGDGFAELYAQDGDKRVLLFDSDLVVLKKDGTFSAACVHTCAERFASADITLDVQLDNAALTIYSVEYSK